MTQEKLVTIDTYETAREAYLTRDLKQDLYADGEVIMADVLVTLHGEDHRGYGGDQQFFHGVLLGLCDTSLNEPRSRRERHGAPQAYSSF